jgi:hypothetical protein
LVTLIDSIFHIFKVAHIKTHIVRALNGLPDILPEDLSGHDVACTLLPVFNDLERGPPLQINLEDLFLLVGALLPANLANIF